MKISTKTIVILRAIDLELKAILEKDLERYRMQHPKQVAVKKAA
ncbi:hypothetical protein [Mucilaginibacter sp.]